MEYFQSTAVQRSLREVKKVLASARHPLPADEVAHSYAAKYTLVEDAVGAGVSSQLLALEALGLDHTALEHLTNAATSAKTVTLQLHSTETCTLTRTAKRDIDPACCTTLAKIISRQVHTIEEHFWGINICYEIRAAIGHNEESVVLQKGNLVTEVKTATEERPKPSVHVVDGVEADLTWMLLQKREGGEGAVKNVVFSINRDALACHTPRRNAEVDAAVRCARDLCTWGREVVKYFDTLFTFETQHTTPLLETANLFEGGIFIPVLPLFHTEDSQAVSLSQPEVTTLGDIVRLLEHEREGMDTALARADTQLEAGTGIVCPASGRIVVAVRHLCEVGAAVEGAVDYVEALLRHQLVAAVGHEVTADDFAECMQHHLSRVVHHEYLPKGCSHRVRRNGYHPEGCFSLEVAAGSGSSGGAPILTAVRKLHASETTPMRFALNATVDLTLHGERFVHTHLCHKFSTEAMPALQVCARAQHFSGFVLMVGTIGGPGLFLPKHAVYVKDGDEVLMPLLLEQIPSAKEFRDAIESLSPAQQRFARAYRALQMEATLFGICVVQVKPLLERALNLPEGSLTQEIALTQAALQLLTTNGIPCDQLAYQNDGLDADDTIPASQKVAAVQHHVAVMQEMIQTMKDEQLEAEEKKRKSRLAKKAEEAARAAEEGTPQDDGKERRAVITGFRVFARLRPFIAEELEILKGQYLRSTIEMKGNSTFPLNPANNWRPSHEFVFDRSLWSIPQSQKLKPTPHFYDNKHEECINQEDMYNIATRDETGTSMIDNAFMGINSCVLAYGQTSSGKTHTMMGQYGEGCDPAMRGIIPRVCEELFTKVQERREFEAAKEDESKRWELDVSVTFVEIYLEKVRDLLDEKLSTKQAVRATTGGGREESAVKEALAAMKEARIRRDPEKGPYVEGIEHVKVNSWQDCEKVLQRGSAHRTTAVTSVHDNSSRSHAIFTVSLIQKRLLKEDRVNGKMYERKSGCINLVDLAGSERGGGTTYVNESAAINKSLTSLRRVIDKLMERQTVLFERQAAQLEGRPVPVGALPHVPYMDSVLTQLLEDSIGGNSKTVMISNMTPYSAYYEETLRTLEWSQKARKLVTVVVNNIDESGMVKNALSGQIGKMRGTASAKSAPPKPQTGGGAKCAPPQPTPAVKETAKTETTTDSTEHSLEERCASEAYDVSRLPQVLEAAFEGGGGGGTVRPTVVKVAGNWSRRRKETILSPYSEAGISVDAQKGEKDSALELLDALTRSGALEPEHATVHVIVAATHCFDKTLIDCVVQDNLNPIASVEASSLAAIAAVHNVSVEEVLRTQ